MRGDPNDGLTKIDPMIREKFNALPAEEKEKSLAAPTHIMYAFELNEQQRKAFEVKDAETLEFIVEHLKVFKKPYVATSFGLHSIILMHLVMRACNQLEIDYPDMILNDTLNTYKEEQQYWSDITELWGIKDKVKLFKPPTDKKGNMYTVWSIAEKVGHLPSFRGIKKVIEDENGNKVLVKSGGSGGNTPECCDILKKKTLKKHLNKQIEAERYDLSFVGTLAEESRNRRNTMLQRCRTFVIKNFVKYHTRNCTPLGFWTAADTKKYFEYHNIPINPAYEAHNQERLGCASCPAHLYWVSRLACDPSQEGFGMLKQNFRILRKTEAAGTERVGRLKDSVTELTQLLKTNHSKYHKKKITLEPKMRVRLEGLVVEFSDVKGLDEYA